MCCGVGTAGGGLLLDARAQHSWAGFARTVRGREATAGAILQLKRDSPPRPPHLPPALTRYLLRTIRMYVSLYHCIIVDRSRYVCIPQRTYQRTICPKDTRPKHGPIALSWRGGWRFACLGLWDNPASPVIPLLFATVLWLDGERRWCGSVSAPDSHGLTLLNPNLHQIITCNTYVVKQQNIYRICVLCRRYILQHLTATIA